MDDSLRVCLVSKQFPPGVGGAETYAYELANGLAERGHDVDVYTQWIERPDESVDDLHENVTVTRLCKARRKLVTFETLWFSYKARRAIDFEAYDIVHGTLMPASTIAVTPFNDLDVPVVVTSHGTSIGETKAVALETPADYLLKFFFHPMNVAMDYVAGTGADSVIAISDHAYDQLTTSYGLNKDKVEMILHGVDTDWFYPREEQHPAVSEDKTTLLYVGRLGARKGLDLAIRALERTDSTELEFLIAGTGRHHESLQALVAELGLEETVRFPGYVPDDDLPVLYSSVDAFVLPSRYEGFGLVLLESMACGTPVVGAAAGGMPTVIQNGENGFLVDRDKESIADIFEQVEQNKSKRQKMAEEAVHSAESNSWNQTAQRTEVVYNELIQEGRTTGAKHDAI